ncbi:excinuclease ABC subunit UvrC [bacterium]|nr:excinuclease ABC subunit UvrC [bacterium]
MVKACETQKTGVKEKAAQLPDMPGVYLLKDDLGEIIYCGKAVSLKKRVASYFRPSPDSDPRKGLLSSKVRDLEYIVTNSELDALILESNLIKKHRPRFNVLLRDDKNYPHLCITLNEPYPRLKIVRRIKKDGCIYFGPYTPSKAMNQTLRLIHQIFPIRRCNKPLPKDPKRPCLNHQIGLCRAPCSGLITYSEYQGLVQEIILFLQGKKDELVKRLTKEMKQAAIGHRYERAATLRDQIRAIQSCMEKQHVFSSSLEDRDCFAFSKDKDMAYVQIFFIRFGKMTGRKAIQLTGIKDIPDEGLMADILKQFYESGRYVPPVILAQVNPDESVLLQKWLSGKRGSSVKIHVPHRGEKRELMLMAQKNAMLCLKTSPDEDGSKVSSGLLNQVMDDLRLPHLPRRIEGFDISNLGSTEAVGSMVLWQYAKPVKSGYRRFKIKDIEGIDDYSMMAEVIRRRYARLQEENGDLPDLILIDGGKGHLLAGMNALAGLGISNIPVVSLAKREELIFMSEWDSPLNLPSRSPTLQLLQRIRDEAHRFAVTFQRIRRAKKAFSSALDNIPGVGPERKRRLLTRFHGLDDIKKASFEELLSTPAIDRTTAKNIFEYFQNSIKS